MLNLVARSGFSPCVVEGLSARKSPPVDGHNPVTGGAALPLDWDYRVAHC
jgi:hypothetical protein